MALLASEVMALLHSMENTAIGSAKPFPVENQEVATWDGLVFHLGDDVVVAALDEVSEILDSIPTMTFVPGAKSWLCGVANVRGGLLPVVDLEAFFFGTATPRKNRVRILIVQDDDTQTGLLVRDVDGMRHFELAQKKEVIRKVHERLAPYVAGEYPYENNVCTIISLATLVATSEFQIAAR